MPEAQIEPDSSHIALQAVGRLKGVALALDLAIAEFARLASNLGISVVRAKRVYLADRWRRVVKIEYHGLRSRIDTLAVLPTGMGLRPRIMASCVINVSAAVVVLVRSKHATAVECLIYTSVDDIIR